MSGARQFSLMAVGTLLLVIVAPFSTMAAADDVLTNADIVKMSKAGLSEGIILRAIQVSNTNFTTTPDALIYLKKQGVSERILGAVLDSRAGVSGAPSEGFASPGISAPPATGGHHQLPAFQADLHVNKKVHEKVSMGHNQIRVEQGGHPVFSLKWEGNPPPKDGN